MAHHHAAGCGCQPEGDGERYSLYRYIDVDALRTFNERVPGSARSVFKPEHLKDERTGACLETETEDEDEERLLLVIPFTGVGNPLPSSGFHMSQ